jgi:uncharacterized protein
MMARVVPEDVATADRASGPGGSARRTTRAQRALLAVIRIYQGWRSGRLSPCRFYPSCSAYASEAVEEHGAGRGSLLALRRLARCHPLGGRGIDLVPPRRAIGGRP